MRRRLRTAVLMTVVAGIALVATGCGGHGRHIVCLRVDRTGSSEGAEALQWRDVGPVLDFAEAKKVRLLGDVIDSQSRNAKFPTRTTFAPEPRHEGAARKEKEDLDADRDDATAQLRRMLDTSPPHGESDVIGAITSCARAARPEAGGHPIDIVLISDMVDTRFVGLPRTRPAMKTVLDTMDRDGEIPDLRGMSVWVDTITMTGRNPYTQPELNAMEWFFRELVRRGHGIVKRYSDLMAMST